MDIKRPVEPQWELFVLDQLPTPVLITSLSGDIEYVNPAFSKTSGFSKEELLGKNPKMLSAGNNSAAYYKNMWQTILDGRVWSGELYNRNKAGQIFLESIYISPLRDSSGKITHFIASWQDITERKYIEQKLEDSRRFLEKTSLEDDLTGLYNRRGFFLFFEQQLKIAQRQGKKLLVLYADLDGFKKINDNLGHQAGDKALCQTAKILRDSFRSSDIVARIGGDEFGVIAIDAKENDEQVIEKRLRESFEAIRSHAANETKNLDISLGIVWADPVQSLDPSRWLEFADRRMYSEKNTKQSDSAS